MRINTSGTLFERILEQNQAKSLRNVHQERKSNDIVQNAKEGEKTEAVLDDDVVIEQIQKTASQSLSMTRQTLEEMKTLAALAVDSSLSNDERVDLQKQMTKLQFRLHENTSSLGLSLIGKSYEDIRPLKFSSVGFINSKDFGAEELFNLADETMSGNLHQDAEIYTWGREGSDFTITSFVQASQEEIESKKADMVNYWDQFKEHDVINERDMMLSLGQANKTVQLIDKRIEKINKMQEEFSKFSALGAKEKLASTKPQNSVTFSSPMGDTVSLSHKRAETDTDFIIRSGRGSQSPISRMSEETNFTIRNGKEYVKIGDESNGTMVRRDIWETRLKKNVSPLGEIEASGSDRFGLGGERFGTGGDLYDFRIKNPDNELGKMVKKLDALLKDEVSKGLSLSIGNFWGGK